MNKLEEQKLVGLFQVVTSVEKQLQSRKAQLSASQHDINTLLADMSHGHKTLRIDSFMEYVKKITICSDQQLYCVFCRLDTKRRGYITQNDLANFIGKTKEDNHNLQQEFNRLLCFLISSQREINAARLIVSAILPYEAYDTIDKNRVGHFGPQDVRRFMSVNHIPMTKPQSYLLCTAIRRYVSRPITLEVFCQFLNPLEFGPYEAYAVELNKIQTEKYLKAQNKNSLEADRKRRELAGRKSLERWDDIRNRVKDETQMQEVRELHTRLARQQQRQLRLERRMELDLQKRVRINEPLEQMQFQQEAYNNLQQRLNLARQQEALVLQERLNHLLNQQSNLKNIQILDEMSRLDYQHNLYRMEKESQRHRVMEEVEQAANSYFQKPINKILDRTAASSTFGRSRSYFDEQLQLVEMELEARRSQMTFQEKVREQMMELHRLRRDMRGRPI